MVKACPNPHDSQWKELVKQVGDRLANMAFVSNGYEMPNVRPISEIKKAIGFKSEVHDYASIVKKIKQYNASNGTSHSFVAKQLGQSTLYTLELFPNYLPVNAELKRQRDEVTFDSLRVEGKEEYKKSLAALYNMPYKALEKESDLGRFNQEGDFIPIDDYIDELVATAPGQVEAVEIKRRQKIDKEILKVREQLRFEEDPVKIRDLNIKAQKLATQRESTEANITMAQKIDSFESVASFADEQLDTVDQILNKDTVTFEDLQFARRTIDLWKAAGDFSTTPDKHIILDPGEFSTPEIRNIFKNFQNKAEELDSILQQLEEDYLVEFVREHTNENITKDEVFKLFTDAGKLATLTKNLGRHDNAILSAIFNAVEKANIKAQFEANDVWEDIDKLSKAVLKKTGNNYNIFKQLNDDGTATGRLVSRFSASFYDQRNKLIDLAFNQVDSTGQKKKTPEAVDAYFNWVKKNTITFDPRILFPDANEEEGIIPDKYIYKRVSYSDTQRNAHIAELKANLGEKGYEYYIDSLKRKLDKFKVQREAKYFAIQAEPGLSEEGKEHLFEEWLKEWSPYWGADMAENPASRIKKTEGGKTSYYSPQGTIDYGIQVPRRTVEGQDTSWYDKNYEKIENDADLLAFHNLTMKSLNQMRMILPPQKRKLMSIGVIPTMKKSIMDIFSEKGMAMGVRPFMDKLTQLQTTTDLATEIVSDINPVTKEIDKQIQLQFIEDADAKIADIVKLKKIKYEQETGKIASNEELRRFKKEARTELAQDKSWDLAKIMKAYTLTVLAYKHKSFIEPQIKLAERVFKAQEEVITNEAGMAKTKNDAIATQKGLQNYISALNFFLDSTYYNIGGRKIEGVTNKKLYTKQEQEKKKNLEELVAQETDPKKKEFLEAQIEALGGFRTASGTFDAVLKFMTFKGLGWNVGSAFSNIGFGVITNLTEASAGIHYNMAQMKKAYMLTTNSVGRYLSGNTMFNSEDSNAVKIRTLMDKYNLLQTSNKELYDTSQKSSFNKLKRFGPFTLQERSEYLNYAPVMIATMMNMKATNAEGKKVELWEAYDTDGKLKEGFTTDVDETQMVQKIKRIIEMNHGDYNNALQIKATVAGRAVSQFRTWMFEGFANRFEKEKVDYALSYGLDEPYVRKGRYRSFSAGQLVATGATLGTLFFPGIGTAALAGAGYLGGKIFGLQESENVLSDTLFTLKQLARKLMFKPTKFQDKFNAVDAANMRRNMTELYILMGLTAFMVLLKGLVIDDDDEEKNGDKAFMAKFLFNQATRLSTDITFYTNPIEFDKLTKTAVPMAKVIDDSYIIFKDMKAFLDDEEDNDVFSSGAFKEESKLKIHLGEFIPGTAQAIKLYRLGDRVIE
jgi:hypothetical protein